MNHAKAVIPAILFLCASLLLPGCLSKDQSAAPDRSVLPASLSALSFEEHLDISIGYWNLEDMAKSAQPDGMTQYIQQLFNITIHPVSVTWSNYKKRYQILSATDSLPDVFATLTLSSNDVNDSAIFTDMVENGSIQALPEDLSPYPVLGKLLDSVSYTRYADGKFYAVPRLSYTDPALGATDAAMLVRRDWMDNLGISDPESFDDFAAMAAAFAHDDPDRNGKDDTAGYNVNTLAALGKWVMLGIAPECNAYSWIEKEGRFLPSWTSESFKDVVSAYRRLYETGALDPAFYMKSPATVMEDFAAGRLGALEYKSSPPALMELKNKWDALNDKPFDKCVDVLPIFPAPDGVRYSNSSSIFWSESYISSAADENKVERILALYEFLLSDRGQELCHYGLEGTDYRRLPDGTCECLLDTQGQSLTSALLKKYPSFSLFSGIASWGGGWEDYDRSEMNNLRYGDSCVALARKSAIWYQTNTTQLTRPYAFLLSPQEPSDRFGTAQAFDAFVNCIIGEEDPAAMWEASLDAMKKQGLEEYIDRQNEHFKRQAP